MLSVEELQKQLNEITQNYKNQKLLEACLDSCPDSFKKKEEENEIVAL